MDLCALKNLDIRVFLQEIYSLSFFVCVMGCPTEASVCIAAVCIMDATKHFAHRNASLCIK